MRLIPIQYHKLQYPDNITPTIEEIAGHFDIEQIKSKLYDQPKDYKFSLHTEYSAKERINFASNLFKENYPEIYKNFFQTSKGKIPKLWTSEKWAKEFALFIINILNNKKPKIIEIHPPTSKEISFETFLDYYETFKNTLEENGLKIDNEHTTILIENRNSWRGREFLLTYIEDFIKLSDLIDNRKSDLRLILDFPQLLNNYINHRKDTKYNKEKLENVLNKIRYFKHNVKSIHLWGQRKVHDKQGQQRTISHQGDMLDYFNNNLELKSLFFETIYDIFKEKDFLYFIPEINGNGKTAFQWLKNIIKDLEEVGFKFQ